MLLYFYLFGMACLPAYREAADNELRSQIKEISSNVKNGIDKKFQADVQEKLDLFKVSACKLDRCDVCLQQ